jgi:hypothetical protein
MRKSVWKYKIELDEFTVDMPRGAVILSVGMQGDAPVFWALVDVDAPKTRRCMLTVGTGHASPEESWEGYRFVGTVGPICGSLWFHLFDGGEPVTELTDVELTHVSIGRGGKFGIGGVVRGSREVHQFPDLDLVARAAFRTFERHGGTVSKSGDSLTFDVPKSTDLDGSPVRIALHLADLSVRHETDVAQLLEIDSKGAEVVLVDGRTLTRSSWTPAGGRLGPSSVAVRAGSRPP